VTVIGHILAAALVQANPATIPAQPPPPASVATVVATPAAKALALELANLLDGEEVTRIQLDKAFNQSIPAAMRAAPEYQALERKYPGLIEFTLVRMRPSLNQYALSRMPALLEQVATIYGSHLTEAELRQVLAFYRSPTGAWVITTVANGSDTSAILQRAMQNPEGQIDGGDLRAATTGAAMPALAAGMTPERIKDLLGFVATPAGRKLRAINAEVLAASAAWTNGKNPEAEARITQVVVDAIREYITKADGKAPKTRS
jgi:hypothetical protein